MLTSGLTGDNSYTYALMLLYINKFSIKIMGGEMTGGEKSYLMGGKSPGGDVRGG